MANYKYKMTYVTFGHSGPNKEQKYETFEDLMNGLGHISMIARNIWISQKIKGKYELIHTINGQKHYTLVNLNK